MQPLCESQFRVLASKFVELHDIHYIIGAIDGVHVLSLSHIIGGECYLYKSLHEIGGPICMLWDYEFGWVRSLHN